MTDDWVLSLLEDVDEDVAPEDPGERLKLFRRAMAFVDANDKALQQRPPLVKWDLGWINPGEYVVCGYVLNQHLPIMELNLRFELPCLVGPSPLWRIDRVLFVPKSKESSNSAELELTGCVCEIYVPEANLDQNGRMIEDENPLDQYFIDQATQS